MGERSFSIIMKTSILLSKLPLQQGGSPRKSRPTQMGSNGVSLVGYTKMLLVSQYSVGCTVVQSGNTGWSSLKCSLLSKNTSQPTVSYISCQFPARLVRFQANSVFCCRTQENAIAAAWCRPFAHWERAPIHLPPGRFWKCIFVMYVLARHLHKWLSRPNLLQYWYQAVCEDWIKGGRALWKRCIGAAVALQETRVGGTWRAEGTSLRSVIELGREAESHSALIASRPCISLNISCAIRLGQSCMFCMQGHVSFSFSVPELLLWDTLSLIVPYPIQYYAGSTGKNMDGGAVLESTPQPSLRPQLCPESVQKHPPLPTAWAQ